MSRKTHLCQNDAEIIDNFLASPSWREVCRKLNLSVRERQICQHFFFNVRETEVASNLGISSHTVHSYVDRMYRKLAIHSRQELLGRLFITYLSVRDHGNRH